MTLPFFMLKNAQKNLRILQSLREIYLTQSFYFPDKYFKAAKKESAS